MIEEKNKIIIDKKAVSRRHVYHAIKRVFDFIASLVGLIILSPVFLVVAIAIKVNDRGPVFFVQKRVGKNGRPFRMYKFRSMFIDAEARLKDLKDKNEVEGPMIKRAHDPRITRVGRFIRKYSLDELPQLVNVLKGDMSLIGPRPALPREVAEYDDYAKQRLLVLPGCTGLWQATVRNSVGFSGMLKLDLEYIQNASVWMDLKILFLTVKVFFVPNGAH